MNNNRHPHFDEIDDRLRDNIEELVTRLSGITPNKSLSHNDELRFGNRGGVAVVTAGRDKGRVTPFDGDGKGLSPFQYIQSEMHCSFNEAIDWAAGWLGISRDYKSDPDAERKRKEKQKRDRAASTAKDKDNKAARTAKATDIYKATQSAAGSPVEPYLAARGISAPLPPDIRYMPPRNGSYGSLVAAARDEAGIIRAIQHIYIHENRKATVTIQKRTHGVMEGAALRLPSRQGGELVLAEGPETGLSVWQAWCRETWVAFGSIAKLANIVPIDRPVIIARDADEPGSEADKALMKAVARMMARGVSVRVVSPRYPTKKGYDFNDALMDYGNDVVANTLENDGYIKPRYSAPKGTVEEARDIVQREFTNWTGSLPKYWKEKETHEMFITNLKAGRI